MEEKNFFRIFAGIIIVFGLLLSSCGEDGQTITKTENTGVIKKQDLEGSTFPVSHKEYDQQNPQTIFIPDKDLWFVIWEDWRNGNADIYGQFIKNDGSLCGNEIQITNNSGNETVPSVTYNKINQDMVIAWQDTRGNSSGGYVYVKKINVSSINSNCSNYTLEPETSIGYTQIDGDNLISRQKPIIKYDLVNDQYIIAWIEKRDKVPYTRCFGRKITTDDLSPLYIGYAVLDASLTSSIIDIVRNDSNSYAIRGREISSVVSSLKEVHTMEIFKNINNVDIGIDTTSNEPLFVFEANRYKAEFTCECSDDNGNNICDASEGTSVKLKSTGFTLNEETNTHIYGIFYHNIKLKGNPSIWIDSDPIYPETESVNLYSSSNPTVEFDPISKRFLVAWENHRNNGNSKIYGQLISSGVGKYNKNFIISYQDTDNNGKLDSVVDNSKQTNPTISYDAVNQRFFVAWQDSRNGNVSSENLDIYGQYIDLEGSLRGNNYSINTDNFNQLHPSIAFNTKNNQYLAVWKDARNTNNSTCGTGSEPCGSDIYGQRFSLGQSQLTLLRIDNSYLAPAIIDFSSVIKDQKATKSFIIKNSGDKELKIDCIDISSLPSEFNFSLIPDEINPGKGAICGDSQFLVLNPGTQVQVSLSFTPTDYKVYTGRFTIKSSGGDKTVFVQGVGVENLLLSGIEISEDNGDDAVGDSIIKFGDILVGSEKQRSITLTNKTDRYLSVSVSGATKPFSIIEIIYPPSDIPNTIPPNSQAVINLSFKPKTRGTYTTDIFISVNLPDIKPFKLTLEGKGVAPVLEIDPLSLNFGSVQINTSLTKTVTIKNTGDGKLFIESCGTTPEGFSYQNCPSSIDAGNQATFSVIFNPKDPKEYTGTIEIKTNAGTKIVSLQGLGKGGVAKVDKTAIDYKTVVINNIKKETLNLTNTGNQELTINKILNIPNGFEIYISGNKINSGSSLNLKIQPNTSLQIDILFKPTDTKLYSGAITIDTDENDITVYLSGQGIPAEQLISIDKEVIDFGTINTGSSKTVSVKITNNSSSAINITEITSPTLTNFKVQIVGSTPIKIQPYSSYEIAIEFNPQSEGFYADFFEIKTDTAGNKTIRLQGKAVTPSIVIEQPASLTFGGTLDFGEVQVNAEKTKTVRIKNKSLANITLKKIDTPLNPFSISSNIDIPKLIAPGETLDIDITFKPTEQGEFSTGFGLLFDDSVDTRIIYLKGKGATKTGTVVTGNIVINPKQINFGKVFIGESKEQTVKIKNKGTTNVDITNVILSNTTNFFVIGLNAPFTLAPNEEKEFKVRFIPSANNSYNGTLSLKDSNNNTYQISLTGIGYPVKVSTDKGTVIDYKLLNTIPYPQNVPKDIGGKLYVHKIIDFVVDTGDHTSSNQEIKVNITLDTLPKNADFYKVNISTGEWTELTNVVIDGNSISYAIKDNSNIDSDNRIGYIEDPIIIGVVKTTNQTGGNTGETSTAPDLGGGSGGCSLRKDVDYSLILMMIAPIGFLLIRRFKMKKVMLGFLLVPVIISLNSCGGSGDGSDVGTSVIVDASVSVDSVDTDLILHQSGPDKTCGTGDDVYVIPPGELIEVDFFAYPVNENVEMSPVKVKSVEIEYIPKKGTLTQRNDQRLLGFEYKKEGKINIPVISKTLKNEIYTLGESGEYYVRMKFKLNEIKYDKDLEVRVGFNLDVKDQLQEGECP